MLENKTIIMEKCSPYACIPHIQHIGHDYYHNPLYRQDHAVQNLQAGFLFDTDDWTNGSWIITGQLHINVLFY